MKTTMKKALSLALSLAMLLSVMLVGMLPASAETTKTPVNYLTAYREWVYAGYSSSMDHNVGYLGIVPDGNRASGVEVTNICKSAIGVQLSSTAYMGATYSAVDFDGGQIKATADELHLAFENVGGGIITIEIFSNGTRFYINRGNSTAVLDNKGVPYGDPFKYTTANNGNYLEMTIPLSALYLEKLAFDDVVSVDFHVKIHASTADGSFDGRLAISPELTPILVANYSLDYGANAGGVAGGATQNIANKTISLTATPDGGRATQIYWHNAKPVTAIAPYGQTAYNFSTNLLVESLADIKDAALNVSCNTANMATHTPALYVYANRIAYGRPNASSAMQAIVYNRNGVLYVSAVKNNSNQVCEEICLDTPVGTAVNLSLVWDAADYTITVFANGVEKGTMTGATAGPNYTGTAGSTWIELRGSADYAATQSKVTLTNLTATPWGASNATILSKGAANFLPSAYAVQTTTPANGSFNARLLATVEKEWIDNELIASAGFVVTATYKDAQGVPHEGTAQTYTVDSVYAAILADGQNVTEEGSYFVALPIKGIPATGEVTLKFQAFAVTAEGVTYQSGTVYTVSFNNGPTV